MKYFYDKVYHELWAKETALELERFEMQLGWQHALGIERLLVVDNLSNIWSPTIILPDLSPHIIIHCLQGGRFRIRLVGPRSKAITINHQRRSTTYIVRFFPLALNSFLAFPTSELLDSGCDLAEVMDEEAISSMEQTLIAGDKEQVVQLIGQFLSNLYFFRKKSKAYASGFIKLLHEEVEPLSVRASANRLGISERYLRKVVQAELGVSPKTAIKIDRFQKSLTYSEQEHQVGWAQIACQSGYYDQSHLIDAYQELLGKSPGQIFDSTPSRR